MHFEVPMGEAELGFPAYLIGSNDADDGGGSRHNVPGARDNTNDEFPFTIELWDVTATGIEAVLAVAANASIGYAAFYAAAVEYPHRHIVIRHNKRILSQWRGRH